MDIFVASARVSPIQDLRFATAKRIGRHLLYALALGVALSPASQALSQPVFQPRNVPDGTRLQLKQRIVGMSPMVGSGGSQVILKGLRPFVGPVTIKFGGQPASYGAVNADGTITAAAPYDGKPGAAVRVTVIDHGVTAESDDLFSYRIAHMEVTGPMPMNPSEIGDSRWASGRGHLLVSYAPDVLMFSEQPVFHVSVAFVDDTATTPASYAPPYAVGNYGLFSAHLQTCDISRRPQSGQVACANWDGNAGTWVEASPAVSVRLNRGQPDQSVSGDLALKTDGLFDAANLVRTLRIAMSAQENDSVRSIGSDRVDSKDSKPFIAVLAPTAFIQVKVIPMTIVYAPPGNASTAFYQTAKTYSTVFKLGNSKDQSNSSTAQETKSTKASLKLTIPAEGSSFGFGVDMGESWDNSTKTSFGTSETVSDSATGTLAFQTQWNLPANPDLLPGAGTTCASITDCTSLVRPPGSRLIEPFWADTFVFSVHPQFAVWVEEAGTARYVQIAAVPVTADATVAQLSACWLDNKDWPGGKPCEMKYSHSILQADSGAPVAYVGAQDHVTLTAKEAYAFLELDPFFVGGQNASLAADRAVPVLSVQYGARIGERPRPVTQSLTQTAVAAHEQSGATTTQVTVTSVRGSDTTFNVAESLFGVLGLSGSVSDASRETFGADLKTTFTDSTVTTTTNATQAQVSVNDQDVTNGCALPHCHLPLPDRPSVNVFLDKRFGGFMFQDPAAPSSPNPDITAAYIRDRVALAVGAAKSGTLRAATPVLDGSLIDGRLIEDATHRRLDPVVRPR
jgi:hypothetical protein